MRLVSATASTALLIASVAAASDEVQLCSEWRTFDANTKADFIVTQSQALLTQEMPKLWIQVNPCFRRETPKWLFRIDDACSAEDPANFDVGLKMGSLVATMFLQCSAELSAGTRGRLADGTARAYTEYKSSVGRYSVRYGATWSVWSTAPQEPGLDMTLQCAAEECGFGSTIAFGILFDPQTRTESTDMILSLQNSQLLTDQVRNSPLVSSVEIHEEGKTTLGAMPAYQVRMTVRFTNGVVRVRHTFFTFARGYWYNVSLGADPDKYQSARRSAQQILSTFSLL